MNPDIKDDDIMPATLSKELLTDLLKGKMGFNGMVLTDASHMVGLTCRMKRSDMIPAAIAAGCDMFLFFNDMDEDFASMMNGYKNGVITDERLDDALHRILALKAHMGLVMCRARTELCSRRRDGKGYRLRRAQGHAERDFRACADAGEIQGRGRAAHDAGKVQAHHDRVRHRAGGQGPGRRDEKD